MRCAVCGEPAGQVYAATCSEECHELLVSRLEEQFGKEKEVIDSTTGVTYLVPVRDIVEKGLKFADLPNYPRLRVR